VNSKTVRLGLFGFGTIGAGVMRLLSENSALIEEKTGVGLELARIVDVDLETDRGVDTGSATLTDRSEDILDDGDISVVIELIGGTGVAGDIVEAALKKGKHVVTANKELIAKRGPELVRLADENGVKILFEASVGGGIPVLTPLLSCLRGNRIQRVLGIVNGTTNYILTSMESTGAEFEDSLRRAQELGYAEADPTNDIEGFDAAYKAVILSAAAFGKRVPEESVYREGIAKVGRKEMEYARELGFAIKLLAVMQDTGNGPDVRVHPAMIPQEHPLASVNGVLNAVYIEGEPIGPLMFVGQGAGPAATSSAVVGDVIALATGPTAAPGAGWDFFSETAPMPMKDVSNAFYIRMLVDDRPGVLADVGRCFSESEVSLASVVQKALIGDKAELVLLTHSVLEGDFEKAMGEIRSLDCVADIPCILRVFEK